MDSLPPDGEVLDLSAVTRQLELRLRGMHPRIQLETDELGRPIDWTWYARGGHAYAYSDELMAVTVESPQTAAALRSQGRWRILQEGDSETTFLVPDDELPEVARKVGLYQRR